MFDVDQSQDTSPNHLKLSLVIGTDAAALSHYALDVAPAAPLEEGSSADRLLDSIRARLGRFLPELLPTRRRTG